VPARQDRSLRRPRGDGRNGATAPSKLRLSLLGGFALELDGYAHPVPPHAQRLLAFLALQTHPLHRAYVAGRLWLDHSQEHAYASLRTTLWRMRSLPCTAVEATPTHVALDASVGVDALEVASCAERVLYDGRLAARAEVAVLSRAGALLPDWYDDWVVHERERLHQLRVLALEATAAGLLADRRAAEAAVAALAAVAADPLRESAHSLLIRAHLASGNAADALRQFELLRTLFADTLGLAPSADTEALVRVVAGGAG
jgi:DNA-binding SARP family transcriptional activator